MKATKHVGRILLLATGLLVAQLAIAQDAETCTQNNCLGIDWENVSLSKLAELNPSTLSAQGRRPLHYAAYNCAPSAAFLSLFERGADPNAIDLQNGLTPLQIAILSCRTATVKVLLEHGADPEAAMLNEGGNTLHLALRSSASPDVLRILMSSEVNLDRQDDYGNAPLVYFVANENPAMMHSILDAGADPNVTDRNGHSVAHYAATNGEVELLSKLRILGADLGAVANSGVTPLHLAADRGLTPDIVAIFHLAKVESNILDASGKAPIHYVAAKSSPRTLAALVVLGSDPNLPDEIGETPFHYALRHNEDTEVVRMLLGWGADPNLPTAEGELPIVLATRLRDDAALEIMVDFGANIESVDRHGRSLLHHAVLEGNSTVAAKLINRGADVFKPDVIGETPAEIARRIKLGDPAGSLIAAKIAERTAFLKQQREQADLAAEERQVLREAEAEIAKERRQARKEKRTAINTVGKGNNRLKKIETERLRAEKKLKRATDTNSEKNIERYTKELEKIDKDAASVTERIEQIRENAKNRRKKDKDS